MPAGRRPRFNDHIRYYVIRVKALEDNFNC
jgi:hypothetical protein